MSKLQERRKKFHGIVLDFINQNPESFKNIPLPDLSLVMEECKGGKIFFVCHLPKGSASFVGKVRGEEIELVKVMVNYTKITL